MNSDIKIPSNKFTMAMNVTSFDNRLRFLIEKRSISESKWIIARDALCNATDEKNNTLLHYAAEYDNAEIVNYLLGSGSIVDAQNALGQTPLMLAALHKCWGITIEFLMKAGANIHFGQTYDKSALYLCADRTFVSKAIFKLFKKRLEMDFSNDKEEIARRLCHSKWPLHKVIRLEDAGLTKIMLERGYIAPTDIDALENKALGQTALHIAVMNVDVENVKILVEHGANMVNDSDKRTPLSYMYDSGYDHSKEKVDILKVLLARIDRARIDPRQSRKIFRYGSEEAIKLIVQSNINLMSIACDDDKNTSVHLLAENENPGTIKHLRNRKFHINKRNNRGETPLIVAAASGNVEAVEFLLNVGADIDAVNANGRTALFEVLNRPICQQPFRKCVQALLERGTNVQIPVAGGTVFNIVWNAQSLILGDLVLAHLAFQEPQGIPITQHIRDAINSLARFRDFFELSRTQLNTVIYERTTLFNLITETDQQLDIYGRGEAFIPTIQNCISMLTDNNYNNYYYSKLLKKRMKNRYTMNPDINIPSNKSTVTIRVTSFESRLLSLIEKHSISEAKWIIARDALCNATDEKNNTLLHYAAEYDNAEIVNYLLCSGSKVDAGNALGKTPLMIATLKSSWGPTVEILMKADANVDFVQEFGKSVWQLAADRKLVSKAIFKLFKKRLEIDYSNDKEEIARKLSHDKWPLPKVIQLEDAELTKIMLQRGYIAPTDIDAVENNGLGQTALYIAMMNIDVENVKILLEYGASAIEDSDGRTALSYVHTPGRPCQSKEKYEILKMYFEKRRGVRIDDPTRRYALMENFGLLIY